MQIKITDSWLREYLDTKASAKEIARVLSLTSVSVERLEKVGSDFVYDIEVTTNRPDCMSVMGLAREAYASLVEAGISAKRKSKSVSKPPKPAEKLSMTIINDPKLVERICAVVLEVEKKDSVAFIKDRLEASGIRNLNNLIDVTNYVMREIGHPAHVFDYDRLTTKKLIVRESRKGEQVQTLDGKIHVLAGGDIVADNGEGEIVDLLGIMGTANSVVTNETKRILFFLDNNDPHRIRKTSMSLGIRSEAAVLNEKGVDPELAKHTLLRGIELYREIANAKVVSDIIDIYPGKPLKKTVSVTLEKVNKKIGVALPEKTVARILENLGFEVKTDKSRVTVAVPSWRLQDVQIEEDIIEEVARIYGYHKLESLLPPKTDPSPYTGVQSPFFWEIRAKRALAYWGFTEVYTYSMVSADLYEGDPTDGVKIQNPLSEDLVYMRRTLVPSLLEVVKENKNRERLHIFEVANVYHKKTHDLPEETEMLAGIIKKPTISFFEVKGVIDQLFADFGVTSYSFKRKTTGGDGADIVIDGKRVGEIEILDDDIIDFELNFDALIAKASLSKVFTPLPKYPPVLEDISLVLEEDVQTGDVIDEIKKQSSLVHQVSLLDQYKDTRTFHIVYQHKEKNLTTDEVGEIRTKIIGNLEKKFSAKLKN